ncbi:NLR family CARD domain-containing protein 3-like [Denticeps clupeoides]|uniref:NLR family CARD domain-containing protein 3-like n=1 Tax=Denticeps clupeoides TaxID=299321 RepID=UPI0010A4D650|nr:NLR family CARD domain-containing protein 3-like [Denticeps clupeoides]
MATTAQQLLQSQKDLILEWTSPNPSPLLRWLYDASVLSHGKYVELLERSSLNALATALETICRDEKSCQMFMDVLRGVQDYYCPQLQAWVRQNCPLNMDKVQKTSPVRVEAQTMTPKTLLSKLFKAKTKQFIVTKDEKDQVIEKQQMEQTPNLKAYLTAHKTKILSQTERLACYSESGGAAFNSHPHIEIRYTDLFITEDREEIDIGQHEYFNEASRRARIYVHQACQRIRPRDLLQPQDPSQRPPKRIKVKGIAGIGKSVIVQKLVHEWALGKILRTFRCVFALRFRELNLIDSPLNLLELLGSRFVHLQDVLRNLLESPGSLLFILDGLDEFQYQLDWKKASGRAIGVETKLPISEMLVELIRGTLLPESTVILTSRPSTHAPKQFFQRCCVVLGFEEKQVREYTSKFYKDSQVAERVSQYIEDNDSLFVLSFIPLYCYIICMALTEFFSVKKGEEDIGQSLAHNPPKTVSEVYYCYLLTTIKHHALKDKADRSTPPAEILSLVKEQMMKLGRLAYENLLKSKIMFDKEDLKKFGLEPQYIHATFLSQILVPIKEEKVEMFSFFHLTLQEHLAAVYSAVSLHKKEDILQALDFWCFGELHSGPELPPLISRGQQHKGLQMFVRFVMGLIRARMEGQLEGLVETSLHEYSKDLPTQLGLWFQSQFRNRKLSHQTMLNLLHCLMELHQHEATSRTALEIKELNLFKMKLSTVDCAAVHYVLQFCPHMLEELNLGYSNIGSRGLSRLGPILHRCKLLFLRYNCLDKNAAILESAVLKSYDCQVKKLFMCGNNLGPDGAMLLWAALEHNATVEELYVDITGITEEGTENIVDCLGKNTALKILTIVGNDIGPTGKKRLKELQHHRPDLRIIGNFADDLGLLQAYLDWVEELRGDANQMESVKNVDALHSVLRGLQVTGTDAKGENATKAKELEDQILQLLEETSPIK